MRAFLIGRLGFILFGSNIERLLWEEVLGGLDWIAKHPEKRMIIDWSKGGIDFE